MIIFEFLVWFFRHVFGAKQNNHFSRLGGVRAVQKHSRVKLPAATGIYIDVLPTQCCLIAKEIDASRHEHMIKNGFRTAAEYERWT